MRRGGRPPDETRGEVITAFVLLKHGHSASPDLRKAAARGRPSRTGRYRGGWRDQLRHDAAEDAQRQDHAAGAQGGRRSTATRATSRRLKTKGLSKRLASRGPNSGRILAILAIIDFDFWIIDLVDWRSLILDLLVIEAAAGTATSITNQQSPINNVSTITNHKSLMDS